MIASDPPNCRHGEEKSWNLWNVKVKVIVKGLTELSRPSVSNIMKKRSDQKLGAGMVAIAWG